MSSLHETTPKRIAELHGIRDRFKGDAAATQRDRLEHVGVGKRRTLDRDERHLECLDRCLRAPLTVGRIATADELGDRIEVVYRRLDLVRYAGVRQQIDRVGKTKAAVRFDPAPDSDADAGHLRGVHAVLRDEQRGRRHASSTSLLRRDRHGRAGERCDE